MSPSQETVHAPTKGFPRVSGDEPFCAYRLTGNAEFSPRERG